MRIHGCTPVVAINVFPGDHDGDINAIKEIAEEFNARAAVSMHFTEGGAGATELAHAVAEAAEEESNVPGPVSRRDEPARQDHDGGAPRSTAPTAPSSPRRPTSRSTTTRPTASATCRSASPKSHLSLSHDASLKGAPTGWTLPVREVRASVGAGFVYPICGDMRTMPGLGQTPALQHIDIDADGNIVGLS